MQKSDGLHALEKPLASLPLTIRNHIFERLRSLTQYEPVIGIMGKTGAGKSSLCNALFQGEVTPVSDVAACTRDVLRFRFRNGYEMVYCWWHSTDCTVQPCQPD